MTMATSTERHVPLRESKPVERHLRVVPRSRSAVRTRVASMFGLTLLFLILLACVAVHVSLVQGQQRIDHLNTQADRSQAVYDQLRLEVDQLQSPARIINSARTFGLVQPQDSTWLAPTTEGSPAGSNSNDTSGTDPADSYQNIKPYLSGTP